MSVCPAASDNHFGQGTTVLSAVVNRLHGSFVIRLILRLHLSLPFSVSFLFLSLFFLLTPL